MTSENAAVAAATDKLNEAQAKVAATVRAQVLRFFRVPPYSDTDEVLSKALAENIVRALVAEGWL